MAQLHREDEIVPEQPPLHVAGEEQHEKKPSIMRKLIDKIKKKARRRKNKDGAERDNGEGDDGEDDGDEEDEGDDVDNQVEAKLHAADKVPDTLGHDDAQKDFYSRVPFAHFDTAQKGLRADPPFSDPGLQRGTYPDQVAHHNLKAEHEGKGVTFADQEGQGPLAEGLTSGFLTEKPSLKDELLATTALAGAGLHHTPDARTGVAGTPLSGGQAPPQMFGPYPGESEAAAPTSPTSLRSSMKPETAESLASQVQLGGVSPTGRSTLGGGRGGSLTSDAYVAGRLAPVDYASIGQRDVNRGADVSGRHSGGGKFDGAGYSASRDGTLNLVPVEVPVDQHRGKSHGDRLEHRSEEHGEHLGHRPGPVVGEHLGHRDGDWRETLGERVEEAGEHVGRRSGEAREHRGQHGRGEGEFLEHRRKDDVGHHGRGEGEFSGHRGGEYGEHSGHGDGVEGESVGYRGSERGEEFANRGGKESLTERVKEKGEHLKHRAEEVGENLGHRSGERRERVGHRGGVEGAPGASALGHHGRSYKHGHEHDVVGEGAGKPSVDGEDYATAKSVGGSDSGSHSFDFASGLAAAGLGKGSRDRGHGEHGRESAAARRAAESGTTGPADEAASRQALSSSKGPHHRKSEVAIVENPSDYASRETLISTSPRGRQHHSRHGEGQQHHGSAFVDPSADVASRGGDLTSPRGQYHNKHGTGFAHGSSDVMSRRGPLSPKGQQVSATGADLATRLALSSSPSTDLETRVAANNPDSSATVASRLTPLSSPMGQQYNSEERKFSESNLGQGPNEGGQLGGVAARSGAPSTQGEPTAGGYHFDIAGKTAPWLHAPDHDSPLRELGYTVEGGGRLLNKEGQGETAGGTRDVASSNVVDVDPTPFDICMNPATILPQGGGHGEKGALSRSAPDTSTEAPGFRAAAAAVAPSAGEAVDPQERDASPELVQVKRRTAPEGHMTLAELLAGDGTTGDSSAPESDSGVRPASGSKEAGQGLPASSSGRRSGSGWLTSVPALGAAAAGALGAAAGGIAPSPVAGEDSKLQAPLLNKPPPSLVQQRGIPQDETAAELSGAGMGGSVFGSGEGDQKLKHYASLPATLELILPASLAAKVERAYEKVTEAAAYIWEGDDTVGDGPSASGERTGVRGGVDGSGGFGESLASSTNEREPGAPTTAQKAYDAVTGTVASTYGTVADKVAGAASQVRAAAADPKGTYASAADTAAYLKDGAVARLGLNQGAQTDVSSQRSSGAAPPTAAQKAYNTVTGTVSDTYGAVAGRVAETASQVRAAADPKRAYDNVAGTAAYLKDGTAARLGYNQGVDKDATASEEPVTGTGQYGELRRVSPQEHPKEYVFVPSETGPAAPTTAQKAYDTIVGKASDAYGAVAGSAAATAAQVRQKASGALGYGQTEKSFAEEREPVPFDVVPSQQDIGIAPPTTAQKAYNSVTGTASDVYGAVAGTVAEAASQVRAAADPKRAYDNVTETGTYLKDGAAARLGYGNSQSPVESSDASAQREIGPAPPTTAQKAYNTVTGTAADTYGAVAGTVAGAASSLSAAPKTAYDNVVGTAAYLKDGAAARLGYNQGSEADASTQREVGSAPPTTVQKAYNTVTGTASDTYGAVARTVAGAASTVSAAPKEAYDNLAGTATYLKDGAATRLGYNQAPPAGEGLFGTEAGLDRDPQLPEVGPGVARTRFDEDSDNVSRQAGRTRDEGADYLAKQAQARDSSAVGGYGNEKGVGFSDAPSPAQLAYGKAADNAAKQARASDLSAETVSVGEKHSSGSPQPTTAQLAYGKAIETTHYLRGAADPHKATLKVMGTASYLKDAAAARLGYEKNPAAVSQQKGLGESPRGAPAAEVYDPAHRKEEDFDEASADILAQGPVQGIEEHESTEHKTLYETMVETVMAVRDVAAEKLGFSGHDDEQEDFEGSKRDVAAAGAPEYVKRGPAMPIAGGATWSKCAPAPGKCCLREARAP